MTRTKTQTLIAAMRILARDIHSGNAVPEVDTLTGDLFA